MHCQADHFNFGLKLNLSTNGIAIFKPLDSYKSAIRENSFVDISKTTFSQYVFAAEVFSSNLEFSELEPLQVSKVDFFMMPV